MMAEQLVQLRPVSQNQKIESYDERHLGRQREAVAHGHVNVLFNVDAAIAKPANPAGLCEQLLMFPIDDRVFFSKIGAEVSIFKSSL